MTEAGYSDAEITVIKSEVDHFEKVRSEVVQANAVDSNLKQTQALMSAITLLVSEIKASEAPRGVSNPSTTATDAPPLLTLPPRFDRDGKV
jgi:hypothetical protein